MGLVMSLAGEKSPVKPVITIEKLPTDALVKVNEFLALDDRVRLASSSKSLQKLIYEECISLWRDVDFSALQYKGTEALTDSMLSNLLIRVNARHVTRSLNLNFCRNINGKGLEPLRGSEVLEELIWALRGYGCSLHEELIPLLRTMMPFKLFHVAFDSQDLPQSPGSNVYQAFLRDLRTARLKDASEQQILCGACRQPVVDDSIQWLPKILGNQLPTCGACKIDFCRRGNCSVGMMDCDRCGIASCDACAKVTECSNCHHTSCEHCYSLLSCDDCSKSFCYECFHESGIRTCDDCNKTLCSHCIASRGVDFRICEGCMEAYCQDCREVKFCDVCNMHTCVGCDNFNYVDCCDYTACEQCLVPHQCDRCNRKYCDQGALTECDLCKEMVCETCSEVNECGTCLKQFCGNCRQTNWLECCGEYRCTSCTTARPCASCFSMICMKHAKACHSCGEPLCRACRSKRCDGCRKYFCGDDCAFVDSCEQCNTTYCQGCRVVVRCPSCGEACCETCRREGGNCEMCNERPSKKAKLSRS